MRPPSRPLGALLLLSAMGCGNSAPAPRVDGLDAAMPHDATAAADATEALLDGAATPDAPRFDALNDDATRDAGVDRPAPQDLGAPRDAPGPSDAPAPRDAPAPTPTRRFWWDSERIDPAAYPDPVWGDGHVHSNFSGDGDHPALAMMNRAHALGADFVWITDHAQTPVNNGGISAQEFDQCSARAREATDDAHFAGCGVEYRLGYVRPNGSRVYEAWHQVVQNIGADEFGPALNVQGYTSWPQYQRDLARTQAWAVITHPSGPTAWFNDDDAAYRDDDPSRHPNTELIELNGGNDDGGNGNNQVDGLNAYFRFLNGRWQLSPVWDSDMHRFYPGAEQAKGFGLWVDRRAWSPARYRATLRESVRRHVSFANHPGNQRNWIRVLSLHGDGSPEALMGSTLGPRESLRLRVRANLAGNTARWIFRLYTNRNDRFDTPARVVGPTGTEVLNGNVQSWEPTLDTEGLVWAVVYASPEPGPPGPETQYLVSAPIWLNNQ
ncbi:MAG: PHP domain-containing protein [Myxococcales bacterium]|nr:PHP domain-containing protein [Myxococcales bacterium]